MASSEAVEIKSTEPSTSNMDVESPKIVETKADTTTINPMEIQNEEYQFVGLGKEDLLVLANQPFWVRLRWALFISFWLLWLGLLVGAALIIALSPGCKDESDAKLISTSSSSHHEI